MNSDTWGSTIADDVLAASPGGLTPSEQTVIRNGWKAIAAAHVAHLSGFARGDGNDSNGDSHGNVGLV